MPDMFTTEKVSVRDYDYSYLSLFTKVFKTNRKKPTIAVNNYVEQNNENEEVNIEKN